MEVFLILKTSMERSLKMLSGENWKNTEYVLNFVRKNMGNS